tara:strand:- start:1591 stop:2628 length:1038 start_codon:yes stop_codon:yes gene_type:complete
MNHKEVITSSYNNLYKNALHPNDCALFHDDQIKLKGFKIREFNRDIEVKWVPTYDLTTGEEIFCPAQLIYLPSREARYMSINTSTGLAAHTNFHESILNGLYESIERDSFTISWAQKIVPPKIKINEDINRFISKHISQGFEWHLFDMSYDLSASSVMGICFGEADFGKFIAVGASTRSTLGEAVKKTIIEIGQAIPFFRYQLEEKVGWNPQNFDDLTSFDDHAVFYTFRQDLWHIFNRHIQAKEDKEIDFNENENKQNTKEKIRRIVGDMKSKGYNVLVKDITTHDIRQLGFFATKVYIPQLIPLAGSYKYYYYGGKRLYEVPTKFGYKSHNFNNLNPFPHPFP